MDENINGHGVKDIRASSSDVSAGNQPSTTEKLENGNKEISQFEILLSGFSAALITVSNENLGKELLQWLIRFVDFFQVDRGVISEYVQEKRTIFVTQHYTVPGIEYPPIETKFILPSEAMDQLVRGQIIRARKIPDDLPPEHHGSIYTRDNTKSIIVVPLVSSQQVLGNISFATLKFERDWPENLIRQIKLIGEIIANAILRKRSHIALLEEMEHRKLLEERYSSIIKNANVGFWISDSDQNILDVNDEYCRLSGYSRDELLSMKITDIDIFVTPEETAMISEEINSTGATHHEATHRKRDGSFIDLDISSTLLEREKILFSFMRDITELNQTRRELEERLKFEELVSEFSASIINVKLGDNRKEINYWLGRFAKLLNVDRCVINEYQDNFTRLNFLFSYTNPDVDGKIRPVPLKPANASGFHKYLRRGEIIKFESADDTFPEDIKNGMLEVLKGGAKSLLVLPLKASEVLFGTMSVSTVTSEKKWTRELVRRLKLVAEIFANTLMRDRTDFELDSYRRHLEKMVDERTAALKEAQKELVLSEKMATLGRLTATVSHELRNPLGTIRSSLFSINRRVKDQDEKTEKALERAERSIKRCDLIIEELLNYSRIETLILEHTDIDNWITELLAEENPPENVILKKELKAGISIEIDRERFRRCMINILTNAYQAIEEKRDNSEPGCVKVITERDESGVEILISDNGVGFNHDDINRIFEPLYSTKNFGVGLGVPVTKQIVEMHGWKMDMKGEPGKGAIVTISIPFSS